YAERKAIFDVYCENEHGEKFIVEMQNAYQTYFKDRSLYYATFPIREQAPKGDNWNFKLQHVYVVALLNYDMNEEAFSHESINHDVGLLDKQTHKVFNNKLTFKYVEIARFNKDINELETNFDKWLYVLRNLSRLDNQPTYLRNEVFNRLFSQAEIARFDKKELKAYEDSLKAYRDIKNSLDTAKEEGRAEGLAEGRAEGHAEGLAEGLAEGRAKGHAEGLAEGASEKALTIARELLAMNMSIDNIKKVTGLTDDEIHNLSNTSL
ncbi:MAG: Rpn family recombination-promoting nuclease/putative transposase, partial [Prevotella sp.]|nr:Rpn family recombination-promoting nuclease/putative transposase [Prevotella sp.]